MTPDPTPIAAKICGLRDRAAVDAAIEGGARWIGLVFFPPSPRFVTAEEAAPLAAAAGGRILRVGLFVRPTERTIADTLARVELDILQIYDDPARADALRDRFGLPVWFAHGVSRADELPRDSTADALVIEAKPPPEADRPGGNGARFDWDLTAGWHPPRPWLLAGGLTPDNVGEAASRSGAPAVDVSSGVETAPGHKDPALIRRFLAAARSGRAGAAQ